MVLRRRRKDSEEGIGHLLGELEARIMRLMWGRDQATVRDILDRLNESARPLAYTTVMTVMARLVTKGILARERQGKTHVYRVILTEEQLRQTAAANRVTELVAEFGDLAIARFLVEVKGISPERRRQLERLANGEDE